MQNKQGSTQVPPLVSFIIAYYDIPIDMLRQCIDSILDLSLKDSEREIIVVDDGSHQSPAEAMNHCLDRITYLRQPNAGLSEARNAGLRMATGNYIQFVDADDYLLKAPYEHCLDIVRQQQPDVVMFDFTNEVEPSGQGTWNEEFLIPQPEGGASYLAHYNLQAAAWCYLFRHAILGGLRFTPGIYHEDEEFTPQLLLRAETIISAQVQAYYYRQRSESITTATDIRTTLRRLSDKRQVISRLNKLSSNLPFAERQAMQRRVAQLTMDYIYNVIVQTRSRHFLDRKLLSLRQEGLYPLPKHNYTAKYKWFRRISSSKAGLAILMNVLPRMNRER